MGRVYKPKTALNKLDFNPSTNPLMETTSIVLKRRHVRTGVKQDLADASTGVVTHAAVIHEVVEKDDAEFVKVFAAGVKASYDLTRTAARVFQVVLDAYQNEPMSGGFADSIYLAWFDGGLSGRDVGCSEDTFNRGLRELLDKAFLAPRSPNVYWVNPSLFFKGDRVAFVKEYVRRRSDKDRTKRQELEENVQQRLVD